MISEKQYLELCDACNRLLLLPESTLEMVAIPWLHVIREHPIVLEKYVSLFSPKSSIENIKARFFNKLVWFRQVFRAIKSDGLPWFGSDILPNDLDIIFISHLLNSNQYANTQDFYFGSIPDELIEKGRSVAIASLSHFRGHRSCFNENFKANRVVRVFFSDSLKLRSEIALRIRVRKESKRLKKLAGIQKNSFNKRILNEASIQVLSGGAQTNLRLSQQIQILVKATNPKVIVSIFEGHAYERILFAAAREVNENICCVSYQHTGVFRMSNAIRNSLAPKYNPNIILTAGIDGKREIETTLALSGIPVSVLGSNRGVVNDHVEKSSSSKIQCLVLPEGFYSECLTLFDFSLSCALQIPEMEFIWRVHPSVSFENLRKKYSQFRTLPKNIIFSKSTLEEDIERCNWALYRGTTAIYKAVSAGLKPVYLKTTEKLTIDPLYKMRDWRVKVENVNDFKASFNAFLVADNEQIKTYQTQSRIFCEEQFSPFNSDELNSVIMSNKD